MVAPGLRKAVRYACRPSTATQRGRSISTLASSCTAPSRSSELPSSLAAAVTLPTRFVMPTPSSGRIRCSAGESTDSVNPPAESNFQNRFPVRAKCRPSSPESVPGLIPQKRTRRSGPTRSARACSMDAKTYPGRVRHKAWGRGTPLLRWAPDARAGHGSRPRAVPAGWHDPQRSHIPYVPSLDSTLCEFELSQVCTPLGSAAWRLSLARTQSSIPRGRVRRQRWRPPSPRRCHPIRRSAPQCGPSSSRAPTSRSSCALDSAIALRIASLRNAKIPDWPVSCATFAGKHPDDVRAWRLRSRRGRRGRPARRR